MCVLTAGLLVSTLTKIHHLNIFIWHDINNIGLISNNAYKTLCKVIFNSQVTFYDKLLWGEVVPALCSVVWPHCSSCLSPSLTKTFVCLWEWKTDNRLNNSIKFTVQFAHRLLVGLNISKQQKLLSSSSLYFIVVCICWVSTVFTSFLACKCLDVLSAHRAWMGFLHSWYLCVPELLRDSS